MNIDEIHTEWKVLRSAVGNLTCHIDGAVAKIESLKDLQHSWQKGYDAGHQDGFKAGVDSAMEDAWQVVNSRWESVQVDFVEDRDLQIASMRCRNCNRWHNEVYHYGDPIEFARYCPFCGAYMKAAKEEDGNG